VFPLAPYFEQVRSAFESPAWNSAALSGQIFVGVFIKI
jgi:hypothetical protein